MSLLLRSAGAPAVDWSFLGASLPGGLTFNRTSNGWYFDETGKLQVAPNSLIANSAFAGAAAPSTLPTGWAVESAVGLTTEIAQVGTENGYNYIDLRIYGTASGTYYQFRYGFGSTALSGQTWISSAWVYKVGGTTVNITNAMVRLREVGGAYNATDSDEIDLSATSASRYYAVRPWTTAYAAQFIFRVAVVNGAAVDITFRIYGPQLEMVATRTTPTDFHATTSAAYYGPRFDYNPVTLACNGLFIEEQRTNSLRNSILAGAVAGSPGTLPTNWSSYTSLTGLSYAVIGTGTDTGNGMPYLDLQVSGTPSAAGTYRFFCETTTQIAAVKDEVWSGSHYHKLVGGTNANVTIATLINEQDSGGTSLVNGSGTAAAPTTSLARLSYTRTLTNASTAYVRTAISFIFANTDAVDITLRIYLPQLEKGQCITSPILTFGAAATRSAEACYTTTIPWYKAASGSFAVEYVIQEPTLTTNARTAVFVNDGTSNNKLSLYVSNTAKCSGAITISGTSKYSGSSNTVSPGVLLKHAMSYIENNTRVAAGGLLLSINELGACAIPSGINKINIGSSPTPVNHVNGWIRRFRYWNYNMDTTTLQGVTK